MDCSVDLRRQWIAPDHPELSVARQCALAGIARSSWSYQPRGKSAEDLALRHWLDEQYTATPFYGVRRMTALLRREQPLGPVAVNAKRVRRLLRELGLVALAPGPHTSRPGGPEAVRHPYLLRGVAITRRDPVWSTDITYLRLRGGFGYLVAVLDWYSRYVLAYAVSNSLEGSFCVEALEAALARGQPEIFNTDQGSQFTSRTFTERLSREGIRISQDGRGRALDNVFIERLWRSVKYEDVYLKDYGTLGAAARGLRSYFAFYNEARPHQGLADRTPGEVYRGAEGAGAYGKGAEAGSNRGSQQA